MNISRDNIKGVKNIPGMNVTSCVVPCTDEDNYPTHDSTYGKGGWREVRTIEERNAIPVERRKLGMAVYVTQTNQLFILKYALNDSCWYEYNSVDVSDIINAAIDKGKINVNIAGCISKGELETTLADYIKISAEEESNKELKEEIQKWVEDKKYLTEHQSLEDYALKTYVDEAVEAAKEELNGTITEIQTDVEGIQESINTLNEFKDTTTTKLGEIDKSIEEINKFISGEEGQEIEVATKASVDTLDQREQQHYEELTQKYDSIAETYATKTDVDDKYNELNQAIETINTTLNDKVSLATAKSMIEKNNESLATKEYLRGFATESFVKDYVARVHDGTVKPGGDYPDYSAEIAALRQQLSELSQQVQQLKQD